MLRGGDVEQVLVEILKGMFSKTDPVLVGVLMILAVLWYRTNRKLDMHLDPKNKYPHPSCELGERSYTALEKFIKEQHDENRQDHQIIFNLLLGRPVPEDLLNRNIVRKE